MLWIALTMGHYGLFCSSELAQPKMAEAGTPRFIRVQDITLQFTHGWLHYVCMFLTSSKTDQFHQGCPVVIGCTGTSICRVCKAWHLLQHHQQMGFSPEALFFQLQNRALDHVTLVNHIKHITTRLRLDPSRYSGHNLHIWGSHCSSGSWALPVADQTFRMLEQSSISSVYKARSVLVCEASCPHGS